MSSPAMIGIVVDQTLGGFHAIGLVGVVLLEAVALYIGSGMVTRILYPAVHARMNGD